MNATLIRKVFSPVHLGSFTLRYRVAMASLSRSRFAQTGDVPGDLMLEYCGRRASEGGFLVTAVSITARCW
jgi:N-ethylmaleimide reductase